uniref:Innexin n=1 Tax=Macrostomum lignano TaxID=282301 RepID=A0A1I8FHQ6_9PLAT
MIESYCWGDRSLRPLPHDRAAADVSRRVAAQASNHYSLLPCGAAATCAAALLCYLPKALFDLICFSRSAYCLSFIRCLRPGGVAAVASQTRRESRRAGDLPGRPAGGVAGERFGNYTFVMYLVTKLAGLAVLLLQLELMRQFPRLPVFVVWRRTDAKYHYGTGLGDHHGSAACRFSFARPNQRNQRHSLLHHQLSNIFIEKVYIILWFYFVLAAITWLGVRFEFEFIRIDGLFFLWMIA